MVKTETLFGYWHSLFPTEPLTVSSIALLNSVLRDPNPRCRSAAIQATASILYDSKTFLTRAENSDKAPTSYTPFSLALGDMIVFMYATLTYAIANESALTVLTHILKCLVCLIQATPFKRLRKGFVTEFVVYIKRLVYHKDPSVQVAAIAVIEALLSSNEKTVEIADCIGIPSKITGITKKVVHHRPNPLEMLVF